MKEASFLYGCSSAALHMDAPTFRWMHQAYVWKIGGSNEKERPRLSAMDACRREENGEGRRKDESLKINRIDRLLVEEREREICICPLPSLY